MPGKQKSSKRPCSFLTLLISLPEIPLILSLQTYIALLFEGWLKCCLTHPAGCDLSFLWTSVMIHAAYLSKFWSLTDINSSLMLYLGHFFLCPTTPSSMELVAPSLAFLHTPLSCRTPIDPNRDGTMFRKLKKRPEASQWEIGFSEDLYTVTVQWQQAGQENCCYSQKACSFYSIFTQHSPLNNLHLTQNKGSWFLESPVLQEMRQGFTCSS